MLLTGLLTAQPPSCPSLVGSLSAGVGRPAAADGAGVCLFSILCACLLLLVRGAVPLAVPSWTQTPLSALFGLFHPDRGHPQGWPQYDAAAQLFPRPSPRRSLPALYPCWYRSSGPFCLIDNIPSVATQRVGVVQGGISLADERRCSFPPELFYFGLPYGSKLGVT